MFFFSKKNNQKIDTFAFLLADRLYSTILPEDALVYFEKENSNRTAKEQKSSQQKMIGILNSIILEIEQYRAIHKLGIYGKARLHLKFTERLKTLGYQEDVATEINKQLLLRTP